MTVDQSQELESRTIGDRLCERVAAIAGMDANDVDWDTPFASYGLGSVDAISLSGELEEWLGLLLPTTLAYDFPTIRELADHLAAAARGAR